MNGTPQPGAGEQWLLDNHIGAEPFNDFVALFAHTRAQDAALATLTRQRDELLAALETARHALVTLNGLSATDGFKAYSYALDDGCDPSGAWDVFLKQCITIDESAAINSIDAAIATARGEAVQG